MESAIVHRAISEERHRHPVSLQQLETVTGPCGLQDARPDYAAGAHHPNFGREQVHAAPAAGRATGLAAIELGEQLARLQSFGQRVAMPAVGAKNHILPPQMGTDADRDRFLSDIRVTGALNEAALMRFRQLLFTQANRLHLAVEQESGGQ